MTDSATFDAHGVRFRVTSPDAAVTAAFDELLTDMRTDGHAEGPDHTIRIEPVATSNAATSAATSATNTATNSATSSLVRVQFDDHVVHAALMEGSLISHVLMDVNQRAARAVWSNGSIPLHASAVAGTGGAIVLAGVSHSGKSTLAAALALADGGARTAFLADEVTALDPTDLVVAPYGKPAALRSPALDLLAPHVQRLRHPGTRFERDERFVPPSELGSRPATPARVIAVVFPRFVDPPTSAAPAEAPVPAPSLVEASPADALTRLMRLALANDSVDTTTFRALEQLVRDVVAYDFTFTDALAAADRLALVLDPSAST